MPQRIRWAIAAAGLALALATTGCGQPVASSERPTNPSVIERINTETDCAQLQVEFDRAETDHHANYMKAADARMRALGCYR